jgi:hypothetical protein
MPSSHGKQGSMHNMETTNLATKAHAATCRHGAMNPLSMRYQFRPGPKMVDEA